jgi:cytochrome P450
VTELSRAAGPARTAGRGPDASGDPFAGASPFSGAELAEDAAGVYRTLRQRHGAVAPVVLPEDIPAWLVLGYRELLFVTSNADLFSRDWRRWNHWPLMAADSPVGAFLRWQPSAEGLEHRRRAGAVQDALAAVGRFDLRGHCERAADGLIDAFAGAGEADLIADFARPLPLLVLTALFGFTAAETEAARTSLQIVLDARDGAMAAYESLAEMLGRLLEDRRRAPRDDVISRLREHPAGLTPAEIIPELVVVLGAGLSPTTDWVGNTLRLMLTDDRFALTLSGGRRSVGQALGDVLWEDPPTPNHIGRWATRGTQLGGRHIRAGDLLILSYVAANNDPALRPDASAASDGNQAYLSFGHGDYRCPYAAQEVAEVMAQTAVEVMLDRLPDLSLAVEPDALRWRQSLWLRGLEALPVTFSPA